MSAQASARNTKVTDRAVSLETNSTTVDLFLCHLRAGVRALILLNMNGYQFAELAPGESLQSPETCDCCGREGLKRTIKLINPEGRPVWFGVGCAAKALSVGAEVVRAARKGALDAAEAAESKARHAAWKAEDSRWQAFLDRQAGAGLDRFEQIQKLGGMSSARAQYRGAVAS